MKMLTGQELKENSWLLHQFDYKIYCKKFEMGLWLLRNLILLGNLLLYPEDCTSNEFGTPENDDKRKAKSRELLEWEGEYKMFCEQFLDLLNIREQYSAENEKELDIIAKLSSSARKN